MINESNDDCDDYNNDDDDYAQLTTTIELVRTARRRVERVAVAQHRHDAPGATRHLGTQRRHAEPRLYAQRRLARGIELWCAIAQL